MLVRCLRPCYAQTRERSCPAVPEDAAVVENFLKFNDRGASLSACQVCFPPYINQIKTRKVVGEQNCPNSTGEVTCCVVKVVVARANYISR
jgi:hypothetical protein